MHELTVIEGTPTREITTSTGSSKASKALRQALAAVDAQTARPNDAVRSEVQLRLYAEKLAQWEPEVVVLALGHWPSRSKWFPTWCELEQDMEVIAALLHRQLPQLGDPEADTASDALGALYGAFDMVFRRHEPLAYRTEQQERFEAAIAWCHAHASFCARHIEEIEEEADRRLAEVQEELQEQQRELDAGMRRWVEDLAHSERYTRLKAPHVERRDRALRMAERLARLLDAWREDPGRQLVR